MSEIVYGNKRQWTSNEREHLIKGLLGRYCQYLEKLSNQDLQDMSFLGEFTVDRVIIAKRNKLINKTLP